MKTDLLDYIKQKRKTQLIFDFDATLYLLKFDWSIFRKGVFEICTEFDKKRTESWDGLAMNLVDELIPIHGRDLLERYLRFIKGYEAEQLESGGYEANKPLLDVVQNLHQKYPQLKFAVWSSNHSDTIKSILAENRQEEIFSKIIGRDKVELAKPENHGFKHIHRDLGGSRAHYLMIGDSIQNDGGAAQAAGIDFLLEDYFRS